MTTTLDLVPVRDPLLNEMREAGRQALCESDPQRTAFYSGLFTGYAVGFGLIDRDALDRARLQPGSEPLHIDFRRPRFDDDPDTLWACGVRHGYLLATSERPDATDCGLCGERITSDDDTESCEHDTFCDGAGCIQTWHAAEGVDVCTYLDDRDADGAL